jgi:hypothetical protein
MDATFADSSALTTAPADVDELLAKLAAEGDIDMRDKLGRAAVPGGAGVPSSLPPAAGDDLERRFDMLNRGGAAGL